MGAYASGNGGCSAARLPCGSCMRLAARPVGRRASRARVMAAVASGLGGRRAGECAKSEGFMRDRQR